mgnify:FL=1
MKKLKLILPMLAFIFAIALSFAFTNLDDEANNDYILRNGQWEAITEVDCGTGTQPCEVTVGGDGPFEVYDEKNLSTQKKGNGTLIILP